MGSIRDIRNVWRDNLVPASFRGVIFHVEMGGVSSGRRTVVHEYPKRNIPYSEDMGRHARRWNFQAYLLLGDRGIPQDLVRQRNALLTALEEDDAGTLIHPSLGEELVMCERYTFSEHRERGGYIEFDLAFVEAGSPANIIAFTDTKAAVITAARALESIGSVNLDNALRAMRARGF